MRQAASLEQFLFGAGSAAAEGFGKEHDTLAAGDLEVRASALLQLLPHLLQLADSHCMLSDCGLRGICSEQVTFLYLAAHFHAC